MVSASIMYTKNVNFKSTTTIRSIVDRYTVDENSHFYILL